MKLIKRNTTPVPESVIQNVKKYLEEHNLGELVEVRRASEHPEDEYLYHVIARKPNAKKFFHNGEYDYSCWTSWNETMQSLNYGHYHLDTYLKCSLILKDKFHRIDGINVID